MARCIYCDEVLTKSTKKQHIIPNGVCGMLSSRDICCSKCNRKFGEKMDSQFVAEFHAILKEENQLQKSYGSKNWPGDKTDTSKRGFNFENILYSQEMAKIALEFAAYKSQTAEQPFCSWDVMRQIAQQGTTFAGDTPTFQMDIIPFYPLNTFDEYIELRAPFIPRHKLILFSHESCLACYIELFSTFACYVILANSWQGGDVYESYVQEVKRFELFPDLDLSLHSYKDLLILWQEHHLYPLPDTIAPIVKNTEYEKDYDPTTKSGKILEIEYWLDKERARKIIKRADSKFYYNEIPLERSVEDLITPEYSEYVNSLLNSATSVERFSEIMAPLPFYCDDRNLLRQGLYRKFNCEVVNAQRVTPFYPSSIKSRLPALPLADFWAEKEKRLLSYFASE